MSDSQEPSRSQGRTRRSVLGAAKTVLGALLILGVSGRKASANSHLFRTRNGTDDKPRPCFLRGTRICTVSGYRNVEDLRAGDRLPTTFGRTSSIRGMTSHVHTRPSADVPWPNAAKPIRIARSALADNSPAADLYLTAPHALLLDGMLVPAGDLLNGTTIVRDEAAEFERLEYFHIELEGHDVVDAEGAPCESLLAVIDGEVALSCAPRVSFDGRRNELRSRLRSALSILVDRRRPLDIVRDRLEERGEATSRVC